MHTVRRELIKVALGEAEADLAIINGSVVNVYNSEIEKASVLIKGERITPSLAAPPPSLPRYPTLAPFWAMKG